MTRRAAVLAALVACVAAGGCSRDEATEPSPPPGSSASASPTPTADAIPPSTPAQPTAPGVAVSAAPGPAATCAGSGSASAPPYTATPGIHPIAIVGIDAAAGLVPPATDLPTGWGRPVEAAEVELVACVRLAQSIPAAPGEPGRICSGYRDEATGLEWAVNLHTATYAVDVRSVADGAVVATGEVAVAAGRCPLVSSYTEGEPGEVARVPSLTAAGLEPLLKPIVTGGASPEELLAVTPVIAPERLATDDLHQVCRGAGQVSAAEYVAGPGIHPVLALGQTDAELGELSVALPEGWAAQAASDTQLVICAVLIEAVSNQICGGYRHSESGAELEVEAFDATYDVTVRVSRTAEVLAAEQVLVPGSECPTFTTFGPDAGPQPYFPEVEPSTLAAIAAPFVATPAPDTAPAPTLTP